MLSFCLDLFGSVDLVRGRRVGVKCRTSPPPRPPPSSSTSSTAVGSERGLFTGNLLVEKDDGMGNVERTFDREVAEVFLREYWQRRPVLFRNALSSFSSPLSPDELAGLACEQDVESRIVVRWGEENTITASDRCHPSWELRLGPFVESDFEDLPEKNYTLLVQEVNG